MISQSEEIEIAHNLPAPEGLLSVEDFAELIKRKEENNQRIRDIELSNGWGIKPDYLKRAKGIY